MLQMSLKRREIQVSEQQVGVSVWHSGKIEKSLMFQAYSLWQKAIKVVGGMGKEKRNFVRINSFTFWKSILAWKAVIIIIMMMVAAVAVVSLQ